MNTTANIQRCQRCGGTIVATTSSYDDDKCANCGWREMMLSPDAERQVRLYIGKRHIEDRYQSHRTFGPGVPERSAVA